VVHIFIGKRHASFRPVAPLAPFAMYLDQSADTGALNLAAKVFDGQKIYVPKKGEAPPPGEVLQGIGTGLETGGKINLNTATLEQ